MSSPTRFVSIDTTAIDGCKNSLVAMGDGREIADTSPMQAVLSERDKGNAVALVTIICATGSAPRGMGSQMAVKSDGSIVGTVGGGNLELFAIRHALEAMKLEALPIPTIAAVNGYALGGGCELALACDVVFASMRAKFGQPEVGLGIIPGFGGTQRLVRAVGLQRARSLIFTGDYVAAARAVEMGLALETTLPDELIERCRKFARQIAVKAPVAIAQAKRTINQGADADLTTGLALERQAFSLLFGTADQKEGMKRKDFF